MTIDDGLGALIALRDRRSLIGAVPGKHAILFAIRKVQMCDDAPAAMRIPMANEASTSGAPMGAREAKKSIHYLNLWLRI